MLDRRRFLWMTATGAAVAPLWLNGCRRAGRLMRAPEAEDALGSVPAGRPPDLASAHRLAKARGKPLLILVVPAEPGPRYERGHALGEALNHGDTGFLADLAACEVACATVAELSARVPAAAGLGEPVMVLIETGERPEAARAIQVALPEVPDLFRGDSDLSYEDTLKEQDRIIHVRIAAVAKALHEALYPDSVTTASRAAASRARLGEQRVAALDATLASGGKIDPAHVRQAAPIIRSFAETHPKRREALLGGLALATTQHLKLLPPAGARWATSTGCGTHVEYLEGDERPEALMIACGMGSTPKLSSRFLSFWTKAD